MATTRTSAEDLVRRGVYKLLTATPLEAPRPYPSGAAAVVKVYDEVPANAAYPYITLGASEDMPDDTHSGPGTETRLSVHVWSSYDGFAELGNIVAKIVERLSDQHSLPVATTGWTDINLTTTARRMMRDEDPQIRHAVIDVIFTANQTPKEA